MVCIGTLAGAASLLLDEDMRRSQLFGGRIELSGSDMASGGEGSGGGQEGELSSPAVTWHLEGVTDYPHLCHLALFQRP
eukprot:3682486-Pyramimonas_sp.AAC.1